SLFLTPKGLHLKAQGGTLGHRRHRSFHFPEGDPSKERPCRNRSRRSISTSSSQPKSAAPFCKTPACVTNSTNTSAERAMPSGVRCCVWAESRITFIFSAAWDGRLPLPTL